MSHAELKGGLLTYLCDDDFYVGSTLVGSELALLLYLSLWFPLLPYGHRASCARPG